MAAEFASHSLLERDGPPSPDLHPQDVLWSRAHLWSQSTLVRTELPFAHWVTWGELLSLYVFLFHKLGDLKLIYSLTVLGATSLVSSKAMLLLGL